MSAGSDDVLKKTAQERAQLTTETAGGLSAWQYYSV
jgi:hypothetical protein